MFTKTWLDYIPLWVLFLGTLSLVLAALEGGYRFAVYRKQQTATGEEAPIGSAINSTLGLLAFLLAFTFGIAAARFDSRRELLLNEVNAIGTTYLRADLVPEEEGRQVKKLLREYVHLRAGIAERIKALPQTLARSEEIQDELWEQAILIAKKDSNSEMHSLFVDSLNEMIDSHTQRVVVGHYQVPMIIWTALYVISILSMAGVGYQFGYAGARNTAVSLTLALSFSIVMGLIADLDRINGGFVQVSQQPMIELDLKLSPLSP